MSARRGDTPSLTMVLTGGIGVLFVVAFVAAFVLGRDTETKPGGRLAVVPTESERLAVLVARCGRERVDAVELRAPGARPLWRIESEKGGIQRSYVVGEDPPFEFVTAVPLQPPPAGLLEAAVTVDDVVDAEVFDPAALQRGEGGFRAECDRRRDRDVISLLFIAGAIGVAVTYVAMVRRWWSTR